MAALRRYLRRKRCPAAAAAGGVRVLESEARAHHIRGVIDHNAIEILGREHINEKFDAELVENEIALLGLFFDVQAVLKARATARHNADSKA